MKRWVLTILTVHGLLLGLFATAVAQDRKARLTDSERLREEPSGLNEQEAQLAEVVRLSDQVRTLFNAGRFEEATPLADRALAIAEKAFGTKHYVVANVLNTLARLYRATGDYPRAESAHLRALAILEKLPGEQRPNIAAVLNDLGELYRTRRDYPRAESSFQRALGIYEKALGREHPYVATVLNNLAGLYVKKGDYVRAEPLYLRTLVILEKVSHPAFATTLNNLAELYRQKGDYARAEPLYLRALADYEQAKAFGPEHPAITVPLSNLALLYEAKGDYARAEPLHLRALAIYEKAFGTEPKIAGNLLNHLGVLYAAKGDYERMVQFRRRGHEVHERILALVFAMGSEQQKQFHLNSLSGETSINISLHVRSYPSNAEAAQLALTTILRRKGRALDVMAGEIGTLRRRATLDDQKLLDQLGAARSRLATLQISGGAQLSPEVQRAEVKRLTAEAEQLEDEVSRHSAEFRTQTVPITLNAVRQAIPADAVLIEIFSYQPFNVSVKNETEQFDDAHYAAYVVRRDDNVPQWVELGGTASIDAEVEQFRAALKDPKRTDGQAIARTLDERLMRPIRKLLGSTRRLFLSPDGALNLIPFSALVDENGQYLIENYSLNYLTSGRDLLRLQMQAESLSAPVVLANPLYDMFGTQQDKQPSTRSEENRRSLDLTARPYQPLQGTSEEAAALGKLLPDARVLTQDKATESALKQVRSPRILHIATHGFFLPDQPQQLLAGNMQSRETVDTSLSNMSLLPEGWENPLLRSGLVLAGVNQQQSGAGEDGVLTALETAGLNLWGTKLVVLSACETGLGDVRNGAGVYGLRRALVLAGSQTQVMSLWKISDVGTRDLMTSYYTRLQAGEGRTEALRQMQLAMLRGELKSTQDGTDYRHPYYWAAFISSGDWRNMDGKDRGVENRSSFRLTASLLLLAIGGIVLISLLLVRRYKARNVKQVA